MIVAPINVKMLKMKRLNRNLYIRLSLDSGGRAGGQIVVGARITGQAINVKPI
jgi:hypothetical protein